jgi:hypothetical protein
MIIPDSRVKNAWNWLDSDSLYRSVTGAAIAHLPSVRSRWTS